MPIGTLKNALYAAALPLIGKRCEWKAPRTGEHARIAEIWQKHHVIGGCIQCFENGALSQQYAAGYAVLGAARQAATSQTFFRTASIAKMVSALLVFRLQTQGKLSVQEDVGAFLGYPVRNPYCPDAPITLGMLLSHTSTIVDSPAYFSSFDHSEKLETLLGEAQTYQSAIPGVEFRYSNLAAGMVGCLLEKRFGLSYEELAQRELFSPLGVLATFDPSTLTGISTADSWRVLPSKRAFDASKRILQATALNEPDPSHHYLLASGGLYLTAESLAKLALTAWNGTDGFLNAESLQMMHHPLTSWPQPEVPMRHGMGLLCIDDPVLRSTLIWGHQGFAYGAVNGVFFDEKGTGFAFLNSGASERRIGHLAAINRDLIRLCMGE